MTAHIFLARLEGSVLASFATGLSTDSLLALAVLLFPFGVQSRVTLAGYLIHDERKLTDISVCFNYMCRINQ